MTEVTALFIDNLLLTFFLLLFILLLTLLFSVFVYMVTNVAVIILLFGVMSLSYFVTIFVTYHFMRSFRLPWG